jgi:ADP-heptose:LPS heptosyltransferase
MFMKNGVWTKGPPPKTRLKGPKVITHRSQRSLVATSGGRLDALLKGNARICVFRSLGGLGDIIMATPIAKGAKRKFPKCHVTYAIPSDYANGDLLDLLLHIPYIDEIIDYKLVNRDDYDSFTNITRVGLDRERPYEHFPNRIDLFAQACAIPLYGDYTPLYTMLEEEDSWGKEFVKKHVGPRGAKGTIAIHLRSNDPKRTWPKNKVREFVNLARQRGYFSFLFGWGDDPNEWTLAGSTKVFDYKIRQAAAVMKNCDVLVCPDSSLLHLGGALNMKTVALFGSMPPDCRINRYPNAIAIVNQQISCLGCVYASCSNSYYCMSSLLPSAVLTAVERKIMDKVFYSPQESKEVDIQPEISAKRSIDTFAI